MTLKKTDQIFISVWNDRNAKKTTLENKPAANTLKGFMGCLRIKSNDIVRLRDTGFQTIALHKLLGERRPSQEHMKGQVVISIVSKTGRHIQEKRRN
jgi:hypothetical protein